MAHFRRSRTWFQGPWRAPVIGMVFGLMYGMTEHTLDLEAIQAPRVFVSLDDVVVFCLPVVLGCLAGLVFNSMRRQERLNRVLSTENTKLQREVFAQLLSSHILHEIRNPLHNLSAAVERWRQQLTPEQATLLQRNMDRLEAATKQLTHWDVLSDEVDVKRAVTLQSWLDEFVQDKVRPQLHADQIHLDQHVVEADVRMHPLLLEQCFVTLFDNALDAAKNGPVPRIIRLSAQVSLDSPGMIEVRMSNTGPWYPEEVLAKQGAEPVESQRGMGLGLVFVRRTLEQVGGSLTLTNDQGQATAILRIPGQRT